jgi:hypothetical protein
MRNSPPEQFTQGVRVLMLIDRGIQNSNKGSKRWINKIITTNTEEFYAASEKLIELQNHLANPDVRLYAAINQRKMKKAIQEFKHKQLDLNDDNEFTFYRRINDSFCSCLMQPECRDGSLFLLDCDSKDPTEVDSFLITNFGIKMHYQYPTPNGWHFIVEPFNPAMCEGMTTFEVKKDALMLLNWIE